MADQETLRRQAARQFKARQAEIEKFVLGLEKFLRGNIKSVLKRTKLGTPREAAVFLGALMTTLEEVGLRDKVAELEQIFTNELAAIRLDFEATIPQKPVRFSDVDATDIQTLIDFQEARIYSTVTNLVDDTKATLFESVISGTPPDIDAVLDGLTDRMASNVQTELHTAVMSFNRSIDMAKAEEYGLDLFLYIGPDDKVTRDFCQDVLDGEVEGLPKRDVPIYTKDEIESMDNEQGLPVSTSGGGYNCRHRWLPISEELAKKLGYAGRN